MSSLKILFIYTNINGIHEETYSFGLASIVSIAKLHRYQTEVAIVKKIGDYQNLLQKVQDFGPKVIAITSVSSQFKFVKDIASVIKKKAPGTIIVCGGVHPTLFPYCLKETDSFDGIFRGESEYSFIEFLKKVENDQDYRGIENFCYKKDNKIVINSLKPFIGNLDELPYPDKTTYPYADTIAQTGTAPFLFSRGCPFLCTYCSNHAIAKIYNLERNIPRYRSAESSIQEIEETIRQFPVIKSIYIIDDTFGLDKKWREEFCRKYKERIGIRFSCNLRVNIVNEEFIRLLKESECYRISFGVESGNEYIRNTVMNRKISNKQIINAFALSHKYGLETNAINMIGLPGETEDMIWDTIRLNRIIHPTSSGVNIFYPYKGTELGDYCFNTGLVNEESYNDFSNERRDTVLICPEKYKEKLKYFYNNWPVLVYPFDISRRLKWLVMKNPALWNFLRDMKRQISREQL